MPYLHITIGDQEPYTFLLEKDKITIGRNQENDVVVPDNIISRVHAQIVQQNDKYILADLGSYNGTKVNDDLIQEIQLKEGDEIRIGKARLIFSHEEKYSAVQTKTFTSVQMFKENDWQQQTIASITDVSCQQDSNALWATISPGAKKTVKAEKPASKIEEELSSLERTTKVLFVLYEVSRQMNALHDFNELLTKIMDLIFMVIDADYGFLILTKEDDPEDFTPVVIKSKDSKKQNPEDMSISRTIIKKVIQDKVALLTSNAMADSRLAQAQSIHKKKIQSAICVPLWDKDKIIGVIQLNSTHLSNLFDKDDLELLKTIGCQMAMILGQVRLNEQIREEEELRRRLERFHSPQVIDMIITGNQADKDNLMEAKDITATILFTDIAGFSSMAEKMTPREVNQILNTHFSHMTDIIFEFDGTLDKYIGDGLMAVFGAPYEKADDAERAVRAALRMKKEFLKMMEKESQERKFNMRLGINSGRVVAGNIGSPRRMDYTVIGDPVNIASRLEALALSNQIIIGEETYQRVKGRFKIEKIGPKKLKGKAIEIMTYEVLE